MSHDAVIAFTFICHIEVFPEFAFQQLCSEVGTEDKLAEGQALTVAQFVET